MGELDNPTNTTDTSADGKGSVPTANSADASGASAGSSGQPKVWTEAEVQALLANRGRDDATIAAREAKVRQAEEAVEALRLKRQQEELDAVKGNLDAVAFLQAKHKLENDRQAFESERKNLSAKLERLETIEFTEMVTEVATKNKVDAAKLNTEASKLKAQGFKGDQLKTLVEAFAKVMVPQDTKTPPAIPPVDSQRRTAGNQPDFAKMTPTQLIAQGLAEKAKNKTK